MRHHWSMYMYSTSKWMTREMVPFKSTFYCWHLFCVSSEVRVNLLISGDTCLMSRQMYVSTCLYLWHLFYVSSEVRVNLFISGDTCFMSLQRYVSTCLYLVTLILCLIRGTCQLVCIWWHLFYVSSEVHVNMSFGGSHRNIWSWKQNDEGIALQ